MAENRFGIARFARLAGIALATRPAGHARRATSAAVAAALALVLAGGMLLAPHAGATADPCEAATGNPGPPPSDPEPLIAGTVWDAGEEAAVAGADVTLYRCVEGTSVYADDMTTNGAGQFAFGSLNGPAWYVVVVSEDGVLSGMSPASGTANPTAPIEVGPGDDALVLAFE